MSLHIIAAVRPLVQLKGSLKFTAIELAHLASRSGYVRVSYWTLATKTGLHIRTMIRHIHQLVARGVIVKQTVRLTLTRFAVNQYRFLVGVEDLHKRSSDRLATQSIPEEKNLVNLRVRVKEVSAKGAALLRSYGLNPAGPILSACLAPRSP
jgi:hypothetical protein